MSPESVSLNETYLTTEDLAILFHCHTATIKRAVERRAIPSPVRIGHRLLWNRKEMLEFIDRKKPSFCEVSDNENEISPL